MRPALPPLGVQAHVETSMAPDMLRELRAVVVAVTREPTEWDAALARRDPSTLWAIGAHPDDATALDDFDVERFRQALEATVFVGEVGLDARAKTDRRRQRQVFDVVLDSLVHDPRPVTIHSTAATGDVLTALSARTVAAPVLHWWRGAFADNRRSEARGLLLDQRARGSRAPRAAPRPPRARADRN